MTLRHTVRLASLALLVSSAVPAQATVISFLNDLGGFNGAAGTPAIAIDFESLSGNIAGIPIAGVAFSSPSGNTLEVVPGASTTTSAGFSGVIDASTNRLLPTAGSVNVLSPGGIALVPGPALGQQDGLQIDLGVAVPAFGIDVLFQSLDFFPGMSFVVRSATNAVVASGTIDNSQGIGGGAPGGSVFIGFVSGDPLTNIQSILFTDNDENETNPDANFGFDTIRFDITPTQTPVPEPATLALLGMGLLACLSSRRFTMLRLLSRER